MSLLLVAPLLLAPAARSAAAQPRDLVAAGTLSGTAVAGELRTVTGSRLAPEGTPASSPGAVAILGGGSSLVADLGTRVPVGALLLQADHACDYLVETSNDGRAWTPLWRAGAFLTAYGLPPMGLRTRTLAPPRPVEARFLRLSGRRPAGDGAGPCAVSRLRAYPSVPPGWPPELDYRLPGSRPPPFPAIGIREDFLLKHVLATVALALLAWTLVASRRGEAPATRRGRRIALAALAAAAALAWPNFLNFHFMYRYKIHDFYHYYLGAKYAPELRYDGLYACTTVADAEDGLAALAGARPMRDLATGRIVSSAAVLASPERCLDRFSPARWEQFRRDVRWFRERHPTPELWNARLLDHGFNASPAWLVAGAALANLVPATDAGITALFCLDFLLLGAGAAAILAVFGLEAAVAAVTFFCLNGIAVFQFTGGSFLRYDWLFWSILGICGLRTGRERLAGFSLACAALLRVFPAVLAGGVAAKALVEVARARGARPLRAYRNLLAGALLALAVVLPPSLLAAGRPGAWGEFLANGRKHYAALSGTAGANTLGLDYVLRHAGRAEDAPADGAGRTALRLLATAGFLLLFLRAVGGEAPWAAAVLGVAAMPFALNLSNYYYAAFALLGLLWAASPPAGFALAVLAWVSWLPVELLGQRSWYEAQSLLVAAFATLLVGAAGHGRPGRLQSGGGRRIIPPAVRDHDPDVTGAPAGREREAGEPVRASTAVAGEG